VTVSPSIVLMTWASGVAAVTALVAGRRIVGPGFTWLSAGVILCLGVPGALGSDGRWGWSGVVLAALLFVVARRPVIAATGAAAAAVFLAVGGLAESGGAPVVTGLVALGGVTGEMMLGHWYLVDPTLPRSILRGLDVLGSLGVAADVVLLVALGAIPWAGADAVMGWGFVVLAVTTLVLMTAVWFALGERGYAGVMAATGLSYLAVLTAIGTAVVGRILAG
jgi:hypothetical protein